MVSINYAFKEISCKIVYYGPGLSGKTTNLQYVHKKVPKPTKGELISLATDADRTLYFDFLPINIGSVAGFTTKFQLYTVPGQVYYNATRKLVLRGVDGLVFVADSQESKMEENVESLKNLLDNLQEYGYYLSEAPMVIQYNKRDLPGAVPIDVLQKALNPEGLPYFEAVAVKGEGVFDTLKWIIKLVLEKAQAKSQTPPSGPERTVSAPAPGLPESTVEIPPIAVPSPRSVLEPVGAGYRVSALEATARVVDRPLIAAGIGERSTVATVPAYKKPEPVSAFERSTETRPEFRLKNRPVLRPSELVKNRAEPVAPRKSFFARLFSLFAKEKK